MPNARQLLEQADALMRRNRKRAKGKGGGPPTLTDALDAEHTGTLAPTVMLPDASPPAADPIDLRALPGADALARADAPGADPIALDTLSDLPVLTDVVDAWPLHAADSWPPITPNADLTALGDALEADALAVTPDALAADDSPSVVAPIEDARAHFPDLRGLLDADRPRSPADESAAGVREPTQSAEAPTHEEPMSLQDEEFILEIPLAPEAPERAEPFAAAPPASAIPPVPVLAPGTAEWEAMAEEIRMQVLQRLDLFTDTGMRDQLGARLQPIVARASAELVETINQALGELVRGYVAEAIEREIETWRKRGG
jgi:hypothetical protein